MHTADLKLMFDYNEWANQRIMAHAAKLTDAQRKQATTLAWGSVHNTLVHLLDAEYGWRMVCQHATDTDLLEPDAFPDLTALQARWQTEAGAMRSYLNSLSDADLGTMIQVGKRQRVLWQLLWHVVNHGMQHRAECAAMLTEWGHSPGEIDVTAFLNQRDPA